MLAEHRELTTDTAHCFAVVFPKPDDCLEVRRQTAGQPHELDIALRLSPKAPTRLNAIEIAIDE
jgi:hypothetical protein